MFYLEPARKLSEMDIIGRRLGPREVRLLKVMQAVSRRRRIQLYLLQNPCCQRGGQTAFLGVPRASFQAWSMTAVLPSEWAQHGSGVLEPRSPSCSLGVGGNAGLLVLLAFATCNLRLPPPPLEWRRVHHVTCSLGTSCFISILPTLLPREVLPPTGGGF